VGLSRSKKKCVREIGEALKEFDSDNDGLSFLEMVTMLCRSSVFRFPYHPSLFNNVFRKLEEAHTPSATKEERLRACRLEAAAATLRAGALQVSTSDRYLESEEQDSEVVLAFYDTTLNIILILTLTELKP